MKYDLIKATALQKMFDVTLDLIFIKDVNQVYVAASMPFVRMAGKSSLDEVIGKSDFDLFDHDLAALYASDDKRIMAEGKDMMDYEEPLPKYNGHERYGSTSKFVLKDEEGNAVGIIGISRDITETVLRTEELIQAAGIDEMTGLLNRAYTMRSIKHFLEGEGKYGVHALLMIDIDNFKAVNDTLGHQQGDHYLSACAEVIRKNFRDSDIVGRVGGDEFFVLMKNVPDVEVVKKKSVLLQQSLEEIIELGNELHLSGSIGISVYRGDFVSLDELYSRADKALYGAKRDGKNKFIFYDNNEGID